MAYSMKEPVIVDAPSNRSKCKACTHCGGGDPTIRMGSKRVGHPGRAAGVTVQHWCHPACFAKWCLRIDLAPTGRSKCKADGGEIAKGAIRLLIGYQKESTVYKVENAHRTILPELVALVGRTNVVIHGLEELSPAQRQRVEGEIFDCSAGSSNEQEIVAMTELTPAAEALRKRSQSCAAEETIATAIQAPAKRACGDDRGAISSYKWTFKVPVVKGIIELE